MTDSSESVFLFKGIKNGLSRIADYSAILQQPLFFYALMRDFYSVKSCAFFQMLPDFRNLPSA